MTLAKDEKIGLVIAAVVGAAALANFAYRSTRSPRAAAAGPPTPPVHAVKNDQAARDEYATILADAFAQDGNQAQVTASGTTLEIRWDMCSKQMLKRLLHDDANYQVKNVREVAGLSVARLKSHGFARVVCDDGRKGLAPAVTKL